MSKNKRNQFTLFQSQLDLAHAYWKRLLQLDDIAIDATCGNGHDTLVLAQLAIQPPAFEGCVIAIDKQIEAVQATKNLLMYNLNQQVINKVQLLHQCHSAFPENLRPQSVKLIVYNLGYLPGSNKAITTTKNTTLESLKAAINLIAPGGAISVTCYPGHMEGKQEESVVLDFAAGLSPQHWSCCYHRFENRKEAPGLLLMQKSVEIQPPSYNKESNVQRHS